MSETPPGRQPEPPRHGGDLAALRRAGAEDYAGEWIDLSTGINPGPYPMPSVPDGAWTRLPSAIEVEALLAAARGAYGCPPAAGIAAAPGTQAAIQWLPRLFAPARVAVLGPTYAEHAYAWRMAGHAVTEIEGLPGSLNGVDVLIVVNPNNPDGRVIGRDMLLRWQKELAGRGGWLIVDEAFADVAPETSLADAAGSPGLLILRSFGKFFGLAGLRLGFVLGEPGVTRVLAAALGPWAVCGPALSIGTAALSDTAWQTAMRSALRERQVRFDQALRQRGIHVIGGTGLFRLAKIADAAAFAAALRKQGVHVRIFDNRPHWMRFGLPADEAEFLRRLDMTLQQFQL
ncbi:MAG TPA: threonine-phosphate decarboxylase CobD [Ferrovibrio sp.]|uniref:threonine-phosphate decarboxylase CobD n=1 Tax=Ferrovibrio sp. TaxID=1917215 RepID=UPI002ED5B112